MKVDERKMNSKKPISIALVMLMLIASLAGCGKTESTENPSEDVKPSDNTAPVENIEIVEKTDPDAETGMKDGERFEATILLEGSEEKVGYEHAISKNVGFELDFEYDSLNRVTESDRERFISVFDTAEDAWNYLDVTASAQSADTVADAFTASLSNDFNSVEKQPLTLDKAGDCVYIVAYDAKDDSGKMQTVFVVPAADGCRVAEAHFTIESAEGFGARFGYMMNTFSPIAK
ncbi:MAG: hypothetical protein IJP43_05490 [Oscillospiraceae bacterium]|nr:hypothetical protein [Oscillospiraceae bacterium]